MQGSRAPCVKARVLARCVAVHGGLLVTSMFWNVCDKGKKKITEVQEITKEFRADKKKDECEKWQEGLLLLFNTFVIENKML